MHKIFDTIDLFQVNGAKKWMVFNGLDGNTRYYVRLVAVGCRGKSQPTKWVKAKTPPGGPYKSSLHAFNAHLTTAAPREMSQPMGDGENKQIGQYLTM